MAAWYHVNISHVGVYLCRIALDPKSSSSCSIHSPLVHFCVHTFTALQGSSQIFEHSHIWQHRSRRYCIFWFPVVFVFALDTFICLFFKASLHCATSSTSVFLANSTTSPGNIICQCASFLMYSISDSIMIANRTGLRT